MHVGNRNKQIATKNMWEVTSTEVHPKYLSFFELFSVCIIFCLIFLLFFFSLFLVRIFIVSLFSLFCTFCKTCFSSFLVFLLFFSLSSPPFVNVLRNPLLYLDWSFLFVSIFLQKKSWPSRETRHFFKLSLFFNQFSHVSSAVLFLFFSFCCKKFFQKKKTEKTLRCFDKPFLQPFSFSF